MSYIPHLSETKAPAFDKCLDAATAAHIAKEARARLSRQDKQRVYSAIREAAGQGRTSVRVTGIPRSEAEAIKEYLESGGYYVESFQTSTGEALSIRWETGT